MMVENTFEDTTCENNIMISNELEFSEEDEATLSEEETRSFSDAVLFSTDWTVETIISQMERGNIDLNPRFQRRDAWTRSRKSTFIESILLGLPIPQIVLAEKRETRGNYLVLDGKQRLLSLLQFTGNAHASENNKFTLTGLSVRNDLNGLGFAQLNDDSNYASDVSNFENQTIRTVIIRNWPNQDFLHTVFLRLNTNTVRLSPQELRQAMVPGPFTDFIDDAATNSKQVMTLLNRDSPDPRMRDVEILVRYISFKKFLSDYRGRMKQFLDESCEKLNRDWDSVENDVTRSITSFDAGVDALIQALGADRIARKPGSKAFNRAIFDTLIYYATMPRVYRILVESPKAAAKAYAEALEDTEFLEAIESDTAGIPNTHKRLEAMATALNNNIGTKIPLPVIRDKRIFF